MLQSKKGFTKLLSLALMVLLITGGVIMLLSDRFEKQSPNIYLSTHTWNLRDSFSLVVADNNQIKNANLMLITNELTIPLQPTITPLDGPNHDCNPPQEQGLNFYCLQFQKPPNLPPNLQSFELEITVHDNSQWNFFRGNATKERFTIEIDTKKPQLAILAHSYKITQGGSALVIFRAFDEHLKNIHITNGHDQFLVQPFYKPNYYIALLAWPKNNPNFSAKILASDEAGNSQSIPINFYAIKKAYKQSRITLTDAFIDGKISELVREIGQKSLDEFPNRLSIFRYINEEIRAANAKTIFEAAKGAYDETKQIDHFDIAPFVPLKNAATMASFGDWRTFFYNDEEVSQSHHMGLDLASTKQAPIILSNQGKVILNEFVGIDGNVLIISHQLGLATLYAHMTSSSVEVGDEVAPNMTIGKTGSTGLALGDHLHFGVLVQGHEVWTAEWMDRQWIAHNITAIIQDAKKIIDTL